jgi:hypothetical protein
MTTETRLPAVAIAWSDIDAMCAVIARSGGHMRLSDAFID